MTSHLETDTKAVEQRIGEIRNRLADITPGPWMTEIGGACVWHLGSGDTICEVNFDHQTGEHQPGEDQEFIANAPSDIAFLLEQLASIPSQIAAAVRAEREACADLAWELMDSKLCRYDYCDTRAEYVARAIRARGEVK